MLNGWVTFSRETIGLLKLLGDLAGILALGAGGKKSPSRRAATGRSQRWLRRPATPDASES
jgi:hypothetical protein